MHMTTEHDVACEHLMRITVEAKPSCHTRSTRPPEPLTIIAVGATRLTFNGRERYVLGTLVGRVRFAI